MRHIVAVFCVGMLLLGGAWSRVSAQQIAIAGDTLLDISLRDADLGETLAALFNTTNGKYSMVLGPGVVGRIGRLQLSQATFTKALDAILGNDFTFQLDKDGGNVYHIYGPQNGPGTLAPATTTPGAPTQAPPSGRVQIAAASAPDPFSNYAPTPAGGGGSAYIPPKTGAIGGTGGTTSGGSSASESSVIRLIKIYNCDVGLLSQYLGGQSIDLTGLLNNTSKTGSSGGGSTTRTLTPAATTTPAATPVATTTPTTTATTSTTVKK